MNRKYCLGIPNVPPTYAYRNYPMLSKTKTPHPFPPSLHQPTLPSPINQLRNHLHRPPPPLPFINHRTRHHPSPPTPPSLPRRPHLLLLPIPGLQFPNPSLVLLLRLPLCDDGIELFALLAVRLPVHAADDHGDEREALRVDARAEHAVRAVVVAGADGAGGAEEGGAG
jgi:hypothetical protein